MKRQHRIVFVLLAFVLTFVWWETVTEYLLNHKYYFWKTAGARWIVETWKNWWIVWYGVLFSLIPLAYLWFSQKIRWIWLWIAIYCSLFFFWLAHMSHKWWLIGWAWTIKFAFAIFLFQFLASYFVASLYAIWSWINEKLFSLRQHNWINILLTWWLWLAFHLLLNHFLILLGIYHPVVLWIYFLLFWAIIWLRRDSLRSVWVVFEQTISAWKNSWWIKYVFWILLVMSLIYVMFGLQLSYIPYPTAWDANHAYFLFPKIFALNEWYIWAWWPSPAPFLWLSYIWFWFGLFLPFGDWLRLSPDTVALVMNFLSGIFVLVLGVVWVRKLLLIHTDSGADILDEKQETLVTRDTSLMTAVGRFGLLLWLTSGMWAFLVFVDNKTDLGVLSLVILALLSWLVMIHALASHTGLKTNETTATKGFLMSNRYELLSGFFFALAVMAKPTAFVDVFTFLLYFIWLFLWIAWVFWALLLWLGFVSKIWILNSNNMLSEDKWLWLIWLGVLWLLPEAIYSWFGKVRRYFFSLIIWLTALVVSVVILKSPHVLYKHFQLDERPPIGELLKEYLMGSVDRSLAPSRLLVSSWNLDALLSGEVEQVQEEAVAIPNYLPLSQCSLSAVWATETADLFTDLKSIQWGWLSEDVGRYVGFGQKQFGTEWIGNALLKLFYWKVNYCYTRNSLAKYLCNNRSELESFWLWDLESLLQDFDSPSQQRFLKWVDKSIAEWSLFASDLPSQFTTYRQKRVVLRQNWRLSVPYRYIIPFNVVQNRSLQNESSYYTDIWFIWLISLCLLVIAFLYSLLVRDRKLFALTSASIWWWILWIVIWWWIVRYGLGLIVWLVLTNVIFLYSLLQRSEDKSPVRVLSYGVIALFVCWWLFQWSLNITRIAKQWGWWPFVYYKQWVGVSSPIAITNWSLSQTRETNSHYGREEVFNLQFSHYNPLLALDKSRKSGDGMYIAGTYAQYFMNNQQWIRYDWLVTGLRRLMSDEDVCASYLRLKERRFEYIVLDPNIATVVMGQWNSSLFHRFLLKSDTQWKRQSNGVMAQIAEMVMAGYMKLEHSSNLWITYAYNLSSQEIATHMKAVWEADEVTFRTKLSSARFFRADASKYQNVIANVFIERLQNGAAIQDIADMFWKIIDESTVKTVIALQAQQSPQFVSQFESLNQDERFVVVQYLNLMNAAWSDTSQFQQQVQRLLSQSLSSWSQVAVWSLVN